VRAPQATFERALLWDSGAVLVLKGLGVALAFLANLAVARLLGADGAGAYYFALAIATLTATVAVFGQDMCVVRFCAAHRARHGIGPAAAVLRRSLGIVTLTSVALAGAMALVLTGLAAADPPYARLLRPATVMCLAVVPFALGLVATEALRALGRVRVSQLMVMVVTPAALLLLIAPLAAAYGVYGAVAAYIGSQAVVAGVALWMAWRAYRAPGAGVGVGVGADLGAPASPAEVEAPRLLKVGASFVVVALLQQLISALPTTVLGFVATPAEVGTFSVALRLAMLISMVAVVMKAVVAPRISVLHATGDRAALWRLLRQSVSGTAAFGALAFIGMLVFAGPLLHLFGPEFVAAKSILLVLAAAQVFVTGTALGAQALAMTGAEGMLRNGYVMAAAVLVLATVGLVPVYGGMGAAVATALTVVLRNWWLCREVKRHLDVDLSVLSPAFWARRAP
jgi:O-antigen/teichoic acid export membrane protein